MKTPPAIKEIEKWLFDNNPLNQFEDPSKIIITNIDPKRWSGHFDYLIKAGNRKYVLRFKGPEWGETNGVIDEYKILKKIEEFSVFLKIFQSITSHGFYFLHNNLPSIRIYIEE